MDEKPASPTSAFRVTWGDAAMLGHFFQKLKQLLGSTPFPTTDFVVRERHWHLTRDAVSLFPSGPDIDRWETEGATQCVKNNPQRVISRVTLPSGTYYLKHCSINTPRAWAREILRPAKARLEFENALRLQQLGIPAIEPVAWGSRSRWLPGDSWLITKGVNGGIPLQEYLEQESLSVRERHQLARELGRAIARIHDRGVEHPDPHPGNFLLTKPGTFTLIDLHAIHFGKPLSESATLRNLVLLNRWFQLRTSRTERYQFWRAYYQSRAIPLLRQLAKTVEHETFQSNLSFWSARKSRHVSDNRDSRRVSGPAASGYAVRDLPEEVVAQWLRDPDSPFQQATILKDSRTSTVAIVEVDGKKWLYKRFNSKSYWTLFKNWVRPSPALRSWIGSNALQDRELPTARPLAMFHRRRFGFQGTGYAVFEFLEPAEELSMFVSRIAKRHEHKTILRQWTRLLARLIRTLHDRRLTHRDLKSANILVVGTDGNEVPVLVDTVGLECDRMPSPALHARDLARLAAGFRNHPMIRNSDRLRFLRNYLQKVPEREEQWKSWWRLVRQSLEKKIRKNERSGRPLT